MNIRTDLRIPKDLQDELADFAVTGLSKFRYNPAGEGRRFCNLNNYDIALKYKIQDFSLQCYKQLGVDTVVEEHMFGNFVGVNTEGAFVHKHTDPDKIDGYWHVRLNFMIQKPNMGGEVVINGIEYKIEQGQSWINFASKWQHSSTPVVGDKPRVVLSMGNYIEPKAAKQLLDQFILG